MPELMTNNDAQASALAIEAVVDSAMVMAFLSLEPAADPQPWTQPCVSVRIEYRGRQSGALKLTAPVSLGSVLAANILGCDPVDEEATQRAADALKELMNITCGAFLARLVPDGGCEMGLPQVRPIDDPQQQWQEAVSQGCQPLDAEGCTIFLRLEPKP